MNIRRAVVWGCAVAALLTLAVGTAGAQSQAASGQIVGTVTDPNGAVVPGAKITVTNLGTGLVRELVTTEVGQYRAVLLPAGRYKVEANASGFAPVSASDVVVNVGTAVDVNFVLKIGAVAETIQVTAPLIEVTRSEAGTIMNDRFILNLPINGRRFQDLAVISPTALVEGRRGQISILGQRGINTTMHIDGADYTEPFFGGIRGGERSNSAFTVPQDSIAEFQVITSGYAAEFGRSTGGVITAVTKSGANDLHGGLFYLLRHKELGVKDARDRQSLETRHQFGANLGGPIKHDRMFFFGSAEQQYISNPRQVFFSRLHQTAREAAFAEAYDFYNQLEEPFTQTNDATAAVGRFDYQFKGGHRFFGRYNHSRNEGKNATSVGDAVDPLTNRAQSNNGIEGDQTHTTNASLISVISPMLANELRFQFSRENRPRAANSQSPGVGTTVGTFGSRNFLPTTLTDDRFQFTDTLNWQHGKHSVRIGGEFNNVNAFQSFGFNQFGDFSLSGSDVRQHLTILSRAAGNRFDSTAVTYRRQIGNLLLDFSGQDVAFFVQDSWRIKPNFTVNYGFRWEGQYLPDPETNNKEALDQVLASAFPIKRTDPRATPALAGQFMPRVGIAWDPWSKGRTVLRANFGIFYARTPMLVAAAPSNNYRVPPGDIAIQLPIIVAGNPNNTVYRQLRLIGIDLNNFTLDKLPILTVEQINAIPAALGATTFSPFRGMQPIGWDPGFENPRSLQWGAGFEHEFSRGLSAYGNFYYANTVHLERNRELNLPFPVIRPTDRAQRQFFGLRSGTARPNPFFGSVQVRESSARSLYRAGSFGTRLTRGRYQFNFAYTVSVNYSDDDNERDAGGTSTENSFNLKPEYNYGELDMRHAFVASALVSLPWGVEVSNTWRLNSASPLDATTGADSNEDIGGRDRPYSAPGVPFQRNAFRNLAFYNSNLRVLKSFRLWSEGAKLQLSAEMFNLFNFDNLSIGGANTIYGLGIDPATGNTLPPQNTASAAFRRIRLDNGRVDPQNSTGVPFQFQMGIRLVF